MLLRFSTTCQFLFAEGMHCTSEHHWPQLLYSLRCPLFGQYCRLPEKGEPFPLEQSCPHIPWFLKYSHDRQLTVHQTLKSQGNAVPAALFSMLLWRSGETEEMYQYSNFRVCMFIVEQDCLNSTEEKELIKCNSIIPCGTFTSYTVKLPDNGQSILMNVILSNGFWVYLLNYFRRINVVISCSPFCSFVLWILAEY